MVSVTSNKKEDFSYIAGFAVILTMVAASVILNDHEVILPEIAAMAIAMWVYREPGWIRQPSRIFLAPSITAVIGFMINQTQIGYLGKIILVLILVMFFYVSFNQI